ncbi:uncharacterized protein LOC117338198 [Pecten maximus]|uniref:uncharacterized protein LOC117338198 n=1 Tax=Pecten maximus TaxID=6579 RepID=UPI0014587604|nr:uncharacterized protein LOC117338198 [Pecten maximus]
MLLFHLQGTPVSCGSCFRQPTYTSSTTVLEAQTSQSQAQFEHEVGVTPVKVDIQVTPEFDTQSIFPGVGSAQRDDDEDDPYGGVIYKYDDAVVTVYVPKRWDGYSNGTVIYTGGNTWSGPTHMQEKRAKVRVRVWSPSDFPCPDFSTTHPVQTGQGTRSFVELVHGLGTVPEYVTVQVRHGSSGWISDGVGYVMTSAMTSINTSWGGVLYAYNESHVRVWIPSAYSGSLYSSADGWGRKYNEIQNSGTLFVKVWKYFNGDDFFSKTKVIGSKATSVVKEMTFTSPTFNTDQGLLSVMVKSTEGPNANFYFPATGAVQNAQATGSYGGLVYSYSTSGIKLWQPPRNHGYLIYVNDKWGGGAFKQSSNSALLVVLAWNAYSICPTTVATSSTMVPPSTSTVKTSAPAKIMAATSGKQPTASLIGQSSILNTSSLVGQTSKSNSNPPLAGATTSTLVNVKGGNSIKNSISSQPDTFQGLSVDLPWWAVGVAGCVTLLLVAGTISGIVLCILRVKGNGKVEAKDKDHRVRAKGKDRVGVKSHKKQAWEF